MVVFWISAGALTIVTLVVVVSPLFRRPGQVADRAAYGVHVFRDQLAEIEGDVEQGFLSSDQAATASFEIKRRLLATAESGGEKHPGIGRFLSRAMLAAIVLAVPAGIISLYIVLGERNLPDNPLAGRTDEVEMASEARHFTSMADDLLARLEANPEDIDGWLMLGRTYNALGRTRDSVKAHSRAYALYPDNPDAAAGYGEALVFEARGQVSEVALKAFEAALKSDPENIKGRYFIGLSKAQIPGKMPEAIEIWAGIVKDASPDAPWLGGLQDQIERARKTLDDDAAGSPWEPYGS